MPPRETGKQRSQRIELDYYRQGSGFRKWKVLLSCAALIFGLVAVVYSMYEPSVANPGPLAAAHTSFQQECSRCHQSLTPIASDSVRNLSIPGLLDINEHKSVQHTFNACTECHNGKDEDGTRQPIGDHFASKMKGDWKLLDQNCALCHADHQGNSFDLTAVADQKCVQCHGKLADVCESGQQEVQLAGDNTKITAFTPPGHGDFASLVDKTQDPGTVTFDHAQHLLPGQAMGKEKITLDAIEPSMRAFYSADANGFVQLNCASCHQLAGLPAGDALSSSADREIGRHMEAISFDRHCSACHSMNPAGRDEGSLPYPHAAPWSELNQWTAVKANAAASRDVANPLGIGVADDKIAARPEADLAAARQMLKTQCLKCHEESLLSDEAIIAARNSDQPLIPSRWLKHGIYDHAAHMSVDCEHCHQIPRDEETATKLGNDQNVVMIEGIESCIGCHRSSEIKLADVTAPIFGGHTQWASDNCILCHRYHTHAANDSPALTETATAESATAESATAEVGLTE